VGYSVADFEVLVSTMDRSDLSFLDNMFPEPLGELKFNVLVVNQSLNKTLHSSYNHIRIINSPEKGLSKSRNLALENAHGKVCLIADDDLVYRKDFADKILAAFNEREEPLKGFTVRQHDGGDYHRVYKHLDQVITGRKLWGLNSIEIAFQIDAVMEAGIQFNEHFGLGAPLPAGEEYVFVRELERAGLDFFQHSATIGYHPRESTGKRQADLEIIATNAAIRYHLYGSMAYLWPYKYTLYLYRHGFIRLRQIPQTVGQAFAGIEKYKQLARP